MIILYIKTYTKRRRIHVIACLTLTHEIEARKRLHDRVMVESNLRRSRGHRGSCRMLQSSLLSSHAARATIRPARFVRMRTIVVAIT